MAQQHHHDSLSQHTSQYSCSSDGTQCHVPNRSTTQKLLRNNQAPRSTNPVEQAISANFCKYQYQYLCIFRHAQNCTHASKSRESGEHRCSCCQKTGISVLQNTSGDRSFELQLVSERNSSIHIIRFAGVLQRGKSGKCH